MEKVREIEGGGEIQIDEAQTQELHTQAKLRTQDYEEDRSDVELTDLMGDFSEQTGALFG